MKLINIREPLLESSTVIRSEVNRISEAIHRINEQIALTEGLLQDETIEAYEKQINQMQTGIEMLYEIADILEKMYTSFNTTELYGPPVSKNII